MPARPGRYLPRPRLDELVDHGTSSRLLLILGSTGQGKRTAVAEVLRARSVVWLTLDDTSDRNARGLQDRILQAIDLVADEPGRTMRSTERPERPVDLIARRLADVQDTCFLVLDDRIGALRGASGDLVGTLLDGLPDNLNLVVISRRSPALDVERRRARGHVAAILDDDLAFGTGEAAAYFRHVWSLALPTETIQEIVDLTDGWPAALQLVASRLARARDRNEPTPPTKVVVEQATNGLINELLDNIGSSDRTFLLDNAIIDELDAETCGHLTGLEDAADRLDDLAAAGLLQRRGDASRTYRHRTLVRQRLLEELRHESPRREQALHQIAAAWFANRRAWTLATEHAAAGDDHQQVLDRLEDHLDSLASAHAGSELRAAMAQLGDASVISRPRLRTAWLDVSMLRGDRTRLEESLFALEQAGPALEGRAAAIQRARSHLARLRGDGVDPLLGHRDRRHQLDPKIAHPLGVALALEGRHDAASVALRCALEDARARQEPYRELTVLADAAWQQAIAGYLAESDLLTRQTATLATRLDLASPPMTARLASAQIALDRGRVKAASSQAAAIRVAAAGTGDLVLRVEAGLLVSRARWTHDDHDSAARVLEEVDRELRTYVPGGGLLSRLARARASLHLALDDVGGAMAVLPGLTKEVDRLPPEDRLIAAALHLKRGEPERAQAAIATLREEGVGPRSTVHALRIEAAAVGRNPDPLAAKSLRRRADQIARSRGLFTPPIHRPVVRTNRAPTAPSTGDPAPPEAGRVLPPVEALTERERDVLLLLPSATNAEMAAELAVTINTVKTHLKSVYRKLDVASREAAVRRASAAGLI